MATDRAALPHPAVIDHAAAACVGTVACDGPRRYIHDPVLIASAYSQTLRAFRRSTIREHRCVSRSVALRTRKPLLALCVAAVSSADPCAAARMGCSDPAMDTAQTWMHS